MKKPNNFLLLGIGILLFIISYNIDNAISVIFGSETPGIINLLLSLITNFGIVVAFLYLIPSIIFYTKKSNRQLYALWLSLFLSIVISLSLKLLFPSSRPDLAIAYPIDILDNSFPSMHALVAFASLPVLSDNFSFSKYLAVFAFLVSFSRIYFGYHFLSDVVFGIFAGYFIGLFAVKTIGKK